ncbi:MAG: ABC-2 transporter permease [Armatimonadetes bacterium]|nr:ABC-2 transporter permease [Armatimonadota bacterium]
MRGLIYKDFYLLRGTILVSIVFTSLVSLPSIRAGAAGVIAAGSFIFASLLIIGLVSNEQGNHTLSFQRLLPVRSETVVDAKFCGLIVIVVFSLGYGLALAGALDLAGLVKVTSRQAAAGLLLGAAITSSVLSIYTWLFFRLGKQYSILIAILIMVVFSGEWKKLFYLSPSTGIGLTGAVKVSPAWLFFGAACFLICLRLARRDFSRREL